MLEHNRRIDAAPSRFLASALGCAVALALVAAPAESHAQDPDNVRILTYNTAMLYVSAEHPWPVPPLDLPLTACVSCNPFEFPLSVSGGGFCQCWPEMSLMPNRYRFANLDDVARAELIANRILASDQDVVVLNEVFHPAARQIFVDVLSGNGPYDHYVSRLRGRAVVDDLTLGDIIKMEASELSPILGALLADIPEFLDYQAVSGDSGLMVFSKYPFLPLEGERVVNDAGCGDSVCEHAGNNGSVPLDAKHFSFQVFQSCEEEDCWASKGVGLVRVATPSWDTYVAFTHMQADYAGDNEFFPHVRAAQLETIRDVILGAIPEGELIDAAVYLAGDINIPGYNRAESYHSASAEWYDSFNPASSTLAANGFFACGNGVPVGGSIEPCRFGDNGDAYMTDSWAFETSTSDRGITNVRDDVRLDYILHSPADGGLCAQHTMIAWDLQADPDGSGTLSWLSDHYPVRGDFGPGAALCSPNDDPLVPDPTRNVHLLQFGPTNCAPSGPNPPCDQDEIVSPPLATIGPAGGFQWFRIDQAGTYSFDLDPVIWTERVDYDVYHHTDLSRPILPYSEDVGEFGITYSMPDPPYYIRTFAVDAAFQPDRTARNHDYTLSVHQHLCRSPVDACVLEPGHGIISPYAYTWPTTVGGSPGDPLSELRELWWKFDTSGVLAGDPVPAGVPGAAFPTIDIQIEGGNKDSYDCVTQESPTIEVYDSASLPINLEESFEFIDVAVDADDADWENDGFPDGLFRAPDLPGDTAGQLKTHFLRVVRNSSYLDGFNPCNGGMTSWVSLLTDLTFIVPVGMEMWAELDDSDDDDLRVFMGFDHSGHTSNPPEAQSSHHTMNEPGSGSTTTGLVGATVLRGYYTNAVWPTLWEVDEAQLLEVWAPYDPFDGLRSLGPWEPSAPLDPNSPAPFVQFSDDSNGDNSDYSYYLYYRLCHREGAPVCANP